MRDHSGVVRAVWNGCLVCAICLAWGSHAAVARCAQNACQASSTVASLPAAPAVDQTNHSPRSANGGPEYSNAPPQIRQTIEDQSDDQENPAFFSRHLIAGRFWISGQSNFIFQAHTPFHAPYSGPNSFHAYGENALSRTLTIYTGVRLRRFSEFILSLDEAGGRGLSDGSGIAAYVNADVIINPDLSRSVYISRAFIHRTIALTANRIEEEPNPFYLQPSLPGRRIDFTFGKFSLLDFFDVNEVGSDSHLQFTNIAIDNPGLTRTEVTGMVTRLPVWSTIRVRSLGSVSRKPCCPKSLPAQI